MLSASDSDVIKLVDFGLAKRLNKRVVCMQGTPEFVRKYVLFLEVWVGAIIILQQRSILRQRTWQYTLILTLILALKLTLTLPLPLILAVFQASAVLLITQK